jgi:hypothetical protein
MKNPRNFVLGAPATKIFKISEKLPILNRSETRSSVGFAQPIRNITLFNLLPYTLSFFFFFFFFFLLYFFLRRRISEYP